MKHKNEPAVIMTLIVLLGLAVLSSNLTAAEESTSPTALGSNPVVNPSNENFTLIVLPDTQGYVKYYPWILDNQTQWIVDNKEALNIVFVTQLGDLVDRPYNITEWENANRSMSKLDGNVPWGVLPGNHDMFEDNLTNYNMYFGYDRFSAEAWYGGAYSVGDNANYYQLFSAGGDDYLILQLQYNPSDDVLYWASNVIDAYPDRKVIVATHDYLMGFRLLDQRSDIGERIWHSLVKPHADQVFLVLCGHAGAEDMITDKVNGHVVYQMLADYQNATYIESGWLRILTFAPSQGKVFVKTYSPILDKYKHDPQSEFTLDYNKAITPSAVPKNPARYNTTYIRADGSIEPPTDLIHRDGDTYVLLDNIFGSLVVERDNVVIDGGGFTIRGYGADYRGEREYAGSIEEGNMTIPWYNYKDVNTSYVGIYSCAERLTVMNLKITEFWCGIELEYSSDNCIVENEITNNTQGVWIHESSNDTISGNTVSSNKQGITLTAAHENVYGNNIMNNSGYGIKLAWSFNNISGNNIENNRYSVSIEYTYAKYSSSNSWNDDKEGNYWSDYESRYPNAAELDDSGTWDTPYVIGENDQDNHPLIKPVAILADDEPSLTPTLIIMAVLTAAAVIVGLAVYRQKRKTKDS